MDEEMRKKVTAMRDAIDTCLEQRGDGYANDHQYTLEKVDDLLVEIERELR